MASPDDRLIASNIFGLTLPLNKGLCPEQFSRDLMTSLCVALVAEACNTGIEPLVRADVPALRRSRLQWVSQNYLHQETIIEANTCLVAARAVSTWFTFRVTMRSPRRMTSAL